MSEEVIPAADQARTGLASGLILSAILFSTKVGFLAGLAVFTAMAGISSIDTFTSGALTRTGVVDKGRDYAAALTFVLAALATLVIMLEAVRRTSRRVPSRLIGSLRDALLLANIPAAFAVGLVFLSQTDLALVLISGVAEAVVLVCFAIAAFRAAKCPPSRADSSPFPWVLAVLLFALVAGANAPAGWAAWVSARGGRAMTFGELVAISWWGAVIAVAVAGLACAAVFATSDGARRMLRLRLLVLLTQGLLLAALVRMVGPLAFVDGHLEYLVSASNAGIAVLAVLGVASAAHLIANGRALVRGQAAGIAFFVTPVAAALIALLIKASPDLPLMSVADAYHTGEYALPYWAFKTYGLLPYVDLSPSRGWINILNGFVAEEWLDGTYTSYPYSHVFASLLVLGLLFAALRGLIGNWAALFVTCLAPAVTNLGIIDLLMTTVLAVLCASAVKLRPTTWLLMWIGLGTMAVLVAPGQGGLLVLATGVVGAAVVIRAARLEPRRLAVGALLLIIGVALLAVTPFRDIVVGAVRYALEQAMVNSQANGIGWIVGAHVSSVEKNGLWQLVRVSWIAVTLGIAIAVYIAVRGNASRATKLRHLLLGLPIVILGLLFIFRAGGRIDPGNFTRLGAASQWFVCVLLPAFILFQPRNRRAAGVYLLLTLAGGAIAFDQWTVDRFGQIQSLQDADMTYGSAIGVPALGRVPIDLKQAENYAALKRFADAHAEPSEPILDLTSRNSVPYIIQRPPALEVSAYNLSSPIQQERVVRRLIAKPPRLALADSQTIRHDGGVVGLRSNPLFRFVIENYDPVDADGAIWMLHSGRPAPERDHAAEEDLVLLDRAFAQRDLGHLPRLWGDVWDDLSKQTVGKVMLEPPAVGGIKGTARKKGIIVPSNSPIEIQLPPGVRGADWGLLIFDLVCRGRDRLLVKLSWTNEAGPTFSEDSSIIFNARRGRLVVPLDALPRWALGGEATALRLDALEPGGCESWGLSKVFLTQRKLTSELRRKWVASEDAR